jgi:hypothetical protein
VHVKKMRYLKTGVQIMAKINIANPTVIMEKTGICSTCAFIDSTFNHFCALHKSGDSCSEYRNEVEFSEKCECGKTLSVDEWFCLGRCVGCEMSGEKIKPP